MQKRNAREWWSSAHMVGLMVLGLVFTLFGCGGEENPPIGQQSFAATTWFGNLTQSQRNSYIIDAAADAEYYGYGDECNCKEWARTVVVNASSSQATIPATCPDASGWYWCLPHQDVRHINYTPYQYPIYAAVAGNIVQMNIGGGPHTAIVWSKDSTDVCFVDANYIAQLYIWLSLSDIKQLCFSCALSLSV